MKSAQQKKAHELLKAFQLSPKLVDTLSEDDLIAMLDISRHHYYNTGKPLITDEEYDLLLELFEDKFPDHPYLETIGSVVVTGKKVKLPYYLGSMTKIKPDTNALRKWVTKYPDPKYVLTDKLDGVSALLQNTVKVGHHIVKGKAQTKIIKKMDIVQKLFTRGNGRVGQDISWLIPYLSIPKVAKNFAVRGELIIPKSLFDKDSFGMKNARNMVAGLVNSKIPNKQIAEMTQFVIYELVSPRKKLASQLKLISKLGFCVVHYTTVSSLSNSLLSDYLLERRSSSQYECDGIIVTSNKVYPHPVSKNPKYAFAFKMVLDDQVAETFVLDVEWNPSKDGYLKPRVFVKEVVLPSCTINYATGYNAKFIMDNKIGPGAKIKLIRSGDVIPTVAEVLTPATKMKLPSQPYAWNKTEVDFVLSDIASSVEVREKRILKFFTSCDVPLMKAKTIAKFIKAGFTTIHSIIGVTLDDIAGIKGFEGDMGVKIHNSIRESLSAVDLSTIMGASNCFGRGFSRKKMKLLLESYPDILTNTPSMEQLMAVKGFSSKTIEPLLHNLDDFRGFIASLPDWINVVIPQPLPSSHILSKKKIVMSGTRDKHVKDFISKVGGNLATSVSKNTHLVIIKDASSTSSKVDKAKSLGIRVLTLDEFKGEFM